MTGFVVVNPEVVVARSLERVGRAVPSLDFIRWRLQCLRLEAAGEALRLDVPYQVVTRSRARQLAATRTAS